jgi:hypothetical protein
MMLHFRRNLRQKVGNGDEDVVLPYISGKQVGPRDEVDVLSGVYDTCILTPAYFSR